MDFQYRTSGDALGVGDEAYFRNIRLFKAASVPSCCLGPSCQACPAGTYRPFSASELSPYVRWLVDGCNSQTALVADPVLTDVSAATGRVVCCRGEYDATRKDSSGTCLAGDNGGVGKTFWEAKTRCEVEGWRV